MAEFTIAGWNITLDERYPQNERIGSIIETLRRLNEDHPVDALGLMEVEGQNGEVIGRRLFGNTGEWRLHSREDQGEHIGMVGLNLCSVTFEDLGHYKTAAFGYHDSTLIATVHLRKHKKYFPPGPEQINQARALLEHFEDVEQGAIIIDPNCLRAMKPREMIKDAGFVSVYDALPGVARPKFPAPGFEALSTPLQKLALRAIGGGIWLDDICVKGLEVIDAGSEVGMADHPLVWTTVDDGS